MLAVAYSGGVVLHAHLQCVVCVEDAWCNAPHVVHVLLATHVYCADDVILATQVLGVACKAAEQEIAFFQWLLVGCINPTADAVECAVLLLAVLLDACHCITAYHAQVCGILCVCQATLDTPTVGLVRCKECWSEADNRCFVALECLCCLITDCYRVALAVKCGVTVGIKYGAIFSYIPAVALAWLDGENVDTCTCLETAVLVHCLQVYFGDNCVACVVERCSVGAIRCILELVEGCCCQCHSLVYIVITHLWSAAERCEWRTGLQ